MTSWFVAVEMCREITKLVRCPFSVSWANRLHNVKLNDIVNTYNY